MKLIDRIYGSVIGGAIGDTLGAPVEGWTYWEIRKKYGKLEELIASPRANSNQKPGGITDDTALRQYVALAIIRKRGRITPDDLAEVWIEKGNARRFWSNERGVTEKLRWGMNPWHTGKGAHKCATGSMGIAPVGIINAGDPTQAFQDGFNIASINQDDFERDAAGTMAAGVAAAMAPAATPDSIVSAMTRHSSFLMKRAFELTFNLAAQCSSVEEFTEKYYEQLSDWAFPRPAHKLNDVSGSLPQRAKYYSGDSHELIPVTLAVLNFCDWDVNRSMVECASFGRDCDSTASMAGALAGALRGASAIKPEWISTCESGNEDLFEELEGDKNANFRSMAERLHTVLGEEHSRIESRAAALKELLESN